MSKQAFQIIGPAGRHALKKTSPYATLLLDISSGLTEEDVSSFKLAIQADKLASRRQIYLLKNGPDVLSFLDSRKLISDSDTEFLQHLLIKIRRKDLERKAQKYQDKRQEKDILNNTVTKERFTKMKDLKSSTGGMIQEGMRCLTIETAVKEVYDTAPRNRSLPEGASITIKDSTDLSSSQNSSSPMSIDGSQGSQVGNCTDEEKMGQFTDKMWIFESDAIMSSQ